MMRVGVSRIVTQDRPIERRRFCQPTRRMASKGLLEHVRQIKLDVVHGPYNKWRVADYNIGCGSQREVASCGRAATRLGSGPLARYDLPVRLASVGDNGNTSEEA